MKKLTEKQKVNISEDDTLINIIKKNKGKNEGLVDDAFKTLFNKYKESISFRYSILFKNEELSKDIVADTFEKAFKNIDKYQNEKGAV